MSEDPAGSYDPGEPVSGWIQPLDIGVGDDHSPCGPDLEYDPDMLELEQLGAGKPETQFAPAEPPDWIQVRDKASELMQRTRDLRVAMHWARANVNLEGFAGLSAALCLLQGMLDELWDGVHPLVDPDDGDTFARLGAIGGLNSLDGLLGDVRNAVLTRDRRLAGLRIRGVEIAADRLQPRPDEDWMSRSQIETALAELPDLTYVLRTQCAEAQHWLKRLGKVMDDRFGIGEGVDLKAMRGMLSALDSMLPKESGDSADADDAIDDDDIGEPVPSPSTAGRRGSGVVSIDSRADAVRAIELVCAYLERSEPTNPAQLLLRRAVRMIDRNFLQLVRDLAPDAMPEVARIMGVNPDDIDDG